MADGELTARQRLLAEGKQARLSYHFGLRPADFDVMTGWEIDHYEQALDELERDLEKSRQQAGR